jgi:hypothetical protein
VVQRQIPKGNKAKIAKLAAAAQALTSGQQAYLSITTLTGLKGLCREPEVANQFIFFLAHRTQIRMAATPRPERTSEADWSLYQTLIIEAVTVMSQYLANPLPANLLALRQLKNRVSAVQNEYKTVGWNTVRLIYSRDVLLIEYALECMLSPHLANEYAYRAGREYAERYEPHYGTGLIPTSAPLLADIVQFWHQYYDL